MTPRVEVGDRVRVVIEGEVSAVSPETFYLDNPGWSLGSRIVPAAAHVVSVEVLRPAEPDWQPGDVVKTNIHFPFLRSMDNTWKVPGSGPDPAGAAQIVSEAWAAGKLTVLHGPGATR